MATTLKVGGAGIDVFDHGPQPDGAYLTCEQGDLIRALRSIKGAVDARSPLEAMRSVRVVSDEHGAHVWATTLRFSARRDFPWLDGSPEPFDALVNHTDLLRALQSLGAGPVTLESVPDGGRCGLRLSADWSTIRVPGVCGEHYPVQAPFEVAQDVLLTEADILTNIIMRASPLASTDEARPILTGLYFDIGADEPRVVSTDSYELCALPLDADVIEGAQPMVLPARALSAIASVLKDAGETPVTLGIAELAAGFPSGQHIALRLGDGEAAWSIQPIEGTYPKWMALLPSDQPKVRLDVDCEQLAAAAARAGKLAARDNPARLVVDRGTVTLRVLGAKGNEYEERLHADVTKGRTARIEVGADAQYLARCANATGARRAQLHIIAPLRPLSLTAGGAQILLMPIRLTHPSI